MSEYSQANLRHIAEDLIDELRELEDGTTITTGELMKAAGYDLEDFDPLELNDVNSALFRIARASRITLDESGQKDVRTGLFYNLPFVVKNKRAQIKCPRCGSTNTVRYLYGMPAWNEEMQKKIDDGKIRLGGCCIRIQEVNSQNVQTNPARYCNDCKKDFGEPPIFLNKNDQTFEDYRDEVVGIKFTIGGFFEGHEIIEIKDEFDEGVWVYVRDLPYGEIRPEPRKLRPDKWQKIIHTLYDDLYLHEWKKHYVDTNVLDGTQWQLEIKLTCNRKRTISGDNAFPPYFKELERLFKEFTKPPRNASK